jgi:hypothetical protein
MRHADENIWVGETELGIAPVRRGKATKVGRGKKAPRAADCSSKQYSNDPVTAFASDLVDVRVVAGDLQRYAGERNLRDIVDGDSRGVLWQYEEKAAGAATWKLPQLVNEPDPISLMRLELGHRLLV